MRADGITIGVCALDQIQSPRPGSGKGWAVTLAKARPELRPGAVQILLCLSVHAGGMTLAADIGSHGVDTPVDIRPIPGSTLFLVRLAGKPFGIAGPAALPPVVETVDPDYPANPAALAAFAAGTLIDTPDGPRPVESLRRGDLVTTLSNGSRPLEWVARRRVGLLELLAYPGLRPVALAPGTVGNDRLLWLSQSQRLLIDDWRAEVFFGEDRVLAAAEALVNGDQVRVELPPDGVEYVMLLCDRHAILLANGALCESFHPGPTGLDGLTREERAALAQTIPEADLVRRRAAFFIVRGAEARALRLPG